MRTSPVVALGGSVSFCAVVGDTGSLVLDHATITGNLVGVDNQGAVSIARSIVWDNTTDLVGVSCTDVQSSATGSPNCSAVNGNISVDLPANTSTEVSIKTQNGSISTAFPITISGKWVGKSARGTIGGGGRDLVIETVNGSVTLRDLP